MQIHNLNGVITPELPDCLREMERGVAFGDGIFETMRISNGAICWWELHWKRLYRGMEFLGFDIPKTWNARFFQKQINLMATPQARVRLTVLRGPGGKYLPENNTPVFWITASPLDAPAYPTNQPINVGFCSRVQVHADGLSAFKTANALRYTLAAMEAAENGWDDGLLLNTKNRVAEATSSNLFILKGRTLCTPPIVEGCVAGVMRHIIMHLASENGYAIKEIPLTFAAVLQAKSAFLTNAIRGITPIGQLGSAQYDTSYPQKIHDLLNKTVNT